MIICCGEALIDMIPSNLENGETAFIPKIGGAVLNTSICLGRLGADVAFLGAVSKDLFGEMILEELEKSKVNTSLCDFTSHYTTLAFAKIAYGTTTYTFFDENSSNKNLSLKNVVLDDKEVDTLYVGGISLMSEPNGTEIENFISKESSSKVVFFDPNVRPSFIENRSIFIQRFENILAQSDIIKISDEDLDWLYPDTSFEDIYKNWLEIGVSIIVLTKGSEGAIIKTKKHEVFVKAKKVSVVDTIGAGDIFNGALLFSLSNNNNFLKKELVNIDEEALEESLKFANKVAGISVGRIGANPPFIEELNS
ncbi:MAG: carbohydrate kinase family protein [Poseidonibacter sp.]